MIFISTHTQLCLQLDGTNSTLQSITSNLLIGRRLLVPVSDYLNPCLVHEDISRDRQLMIPQCCVWDLIKRLKTTGNYTHHLL